MTQVQGHTILTPRLRQQGQKSCPERAMLLDGARIVLRVQPPTATDVEALEEGTIVIGFMNPANNLEAIKRMRDRKITAFALELVPRISRAQSMDALRLAGNGRRVCRGYPWC